MTHYSRDGVEKSKNLNNYRVSGGLSVSDGYRVPVTTSRGPVRAPPPRARAVAWCRPDPANARTGSAEREPIWTRAGTRPRRRLTTRGGGPATRDASGRTADRAADGEIRDWTRREKKTQNRDRAGPSPRTHIPYLFTYFLVAFRYSTSPESDTV